MPQGQTWHNGMAERLCKWWERKESCDLIHCLKCLVGVVMRGVLEKWGGGEKQIHLPWEQSSRKVGCGRLRHRWKSWFKIAAGENLSIGMTPVSGAKPAEAKVVMMVSKVFLQKSFLKWGRGTMLQTKICEHKNRPNNSFFYDKNTDAVIFFMNFFLLCCMKLGKQRWWCQTCRCYLQEAPQPAWRACAWRNCRVFWGKNTNNGDGHLIIAQWIRLFNNCSMYTVIGQ